MNLLARMAQLFGFPRVQGGNVPGWPEEWINNPYRLDRLNWDFPLAMRRVATVRACVLRIAEDLAQLPVVFERQRGNDWEPLPRVAGNVVDVWAKANDQQTSVELVRDMHAHLESSGNAYLVAETFGTKRVHELWLMPPQHVKVVPGPRRSASGFTFNRNGREEVVPAEFVVHLRGFTPDFEPLGGSSLEAVEFQYSTRYDIMRLVQLFVRGGGVPAGYFRQVGSDGRPSSAPISEPDMKRLREQIAKAFGGFANAFRPKVISQLVFDKMGLTPAEMNLPDLSRLTDEDICRALGVPPWMVGVKEQSGKLGDSGGAAGADRGIYVRNTLLPKVVLRDAVLTERLVPMFGEVGVRARTDLSSVVELIAPLVNAAQQVVSLAGGRSVFSVNELRKMFGQPPRKEPEADELAKKTDPLAAFGFGGAPGGEEADAPAETKPAPVTKEEESRRMIDGDERREFRRRQASASLLRYERRLARFFADLLSDQQARVIAAINASEPLRSLNGKRAIDPESVFVPDETDQARLERILADLVRDRGEEALADLALQLELNANVGRAATWVRAQAHRALSLVDDHTRAAVRDEIAKALELGESLGQIVERIGQMPEFGQVRALRIARTETVGAYNFATVDAYEQSGVVEGVEWLSARDSHVRDTHAEADGQVVSLGQSFQVGGVDMSFPGDPGAPPEETVNCRCTTLPVVNERARARKQFQQTLGRLLGAKHSEVGS